MKEKIRQELESLFTEEFVNALKIVHSKFKIWDGDPIIHSLESVNFCLECYLFPEFIIINAADKLTDPEAPSGPMLEEDLNSFLEELTTHILFKIDLRVLYNMEVTKQKNKTLSMSDFISVFDKLK